MTILTTPSDGTSANVAHPEISPAPGTSRGQFSKKSRNDTIVLPFSVVASHVPSDTSERGLLTCLYFPFLRSSNASGGSFHVATYVPINSETATFFRGDWQDLWAPRSAAGLVALAFYAARKAAGRWIPSGECLAAIASHFIETWKPEALKHRATLQRKILERDGGVCQVPGCSRAADHVHHIRFRSAGGSDDPSNLTSICSVHHLQSIHRGRIRVSGTAPDQLRWQLGIRGRERTSDVAREAA